MADGFQLLVDPPLFVTNQSEMDVTLTWQTTVPGNKLSPPRQASIPRGAVDHRVDPGLFWIVHEGFNTLLAENVVFVSVLNDDGAYGEQIAVHADIFATNSEFHHLALAVLIDGDGYLSATPCLDK
jgi:hypothetical protein